MELMREERELIAPICKNSHEVLVRAAMEGKMGRVFVPVVEEPKYCLIIVEGFAYLQGLPPKGARALDLRATLLKECEEILITPENEMWAAWLEENLDCSFRKLNRYILKAESYEFDLHQLDYYISALPSEYEMREISSKEYQDAKENYWSSYFVNSFDDEEHFLANGLGYVIYKGDELVSGCSAYGFSNGYLEVEVITKIGHKRKGLGIAACARFIKECILRGIYPNWDAANMHSVELAQKLGYHFVGEYKVYQIYADI